MGNSSEFPTTEDEEEAVISLLDGFVLYMGSVTEVKYKKKNKSNRCILL